MSVPTFFATPADWRAWLEAHHATAAELSVGFRKLGSGKASITWPESVDEALSFGWIDGVRHRIDDEAYRIRFTPRKAGGIWSQVNLKRFAELEKRLERLQDEVRSLRKEAPEKESVDPLLPGEGPAAVRLKKDAPEKE